MTDTMQAPAPQPTDSRAKPVTSHARDERWFSELFATHQAAIIRYAKRRVEIDHAEDIVASVFTLAWRHRQRVPDDPLPWLYKAAAYEIARSYRSAARTSRLTQRVGGLAETRAHSRDTGEAVADTLLVHQVLAQLPERDAEIVRLAAWENLTTDEIAQVLGCSTTTVRVRLHRAKKHAQAAWKAADHELPTPIHTTNEGELR